MKKLLLSTFALSAVMTGFSQTGLSYSGGFADDFTSGDEYSIRVDCEDNVANDDIAYAGLFWWTEPGKTVTVHPACSDVSEYGGDANDCSTTFSASSTRAGDGSLVYSITQPYNSYEPVGVGFGTFFGDNDFVVDLTADKTMSITFQHDGGAGDNNAKVTFQLQDANGQALAFMPAVSEDQGNSWKYDIGYTGDNGNGFVAPDGDVTFTFDFTGAGQADANGTYLPSPSTAFDYSKVVALTITITNSQRYENPTADGGAGYYHPLKFEPTLTIKSIEVGETASIEDADYGYEWCQFTPVNDEYLASLINISPNPTNGQAVIDLGSLEGDIQVIDPIQTDITAEVLKGNTLDLTGKAAGIYYVIITTADGKAVKRISKQ